MLSLATHIQRKTSSKATPQNNKVTGEIRILKNHLLSIFPLQGVFDYVRLSCIALDEMSSDCASPFTATKAELIRLLAVIFSVDEATRILDEIEAGRTVQVPVTTEQGRNLGFQPKLN